MISIQEQSQGKWFDILTCLGVDPNVLVNKHNFCPLCERKKFRFDNKEGKGTFICTCSSGTGISLAMQYLGMDFKSTVKQIREILGGCKVQQQKPVDNQKVIIQNRERLKRIQSGLIQISPDTAAAKYLKKRGIKVLPDFNCKAHNGIPYFNNNEKVGVFPAIVSTVMNEKCEPATFHVTYLTPEGDKLDCETPKKLLPKTRDWKGGCIRLFEPTEILGIAEGLETALAANQEDGYPVWCAVNATAMEAIKVPGHVKTVVIYVDEDKSFTGQRAAYTLARRLKVQEGKEVDVVRVLDNEVYIDKGTDTDYLDFINRNTVTSKAEA